MTPKGRHQLVLNISVKFNIITIDPYNFELYHFKVDAFFETQCRLSTGASNFWYYKGPHNKLVQTHTKRLLIAKISNYFEEIVVAESSVIIEIYP